MPSIEEKIGIGFFGVFPDKRGARCVNVAPVARNVSRHDATKPQPSQRLFITAPDGYQELYGAITIFQRSRVLKLSKTMLLARNIPTCRLKLKRPKNLWFEVDKENHCCPGVEKD
jgi:hypothetical protein